MRDIVSLLYLQRIVFTSHTGKQKGFYKMTILQKKQLNKLHLPLGLQLNMHMMTTSALHRIYTYTFPHEMWVCPNNTAFMMQTGSL